MYRDHERVRRWRDVLESEATPFRRYFSGVASFVLGELGEHEMLESFQAMVSPNTSRRYRALLEQFLVDGLLSAGRVEPAVPVLERLAEDVLVDVDWLEHCPLMRPLRDEPWMAPVRAKVRARARAIWTLERG